MKELLCMTWAITLLGCAGGGACEWGYIEERANRSDLVLRVRFVANIGGSKYHWDRVKVLGVIKSREGVKLPAMMEIAHGCFEEGIPAGDSTVYLQPYNPKKMDHWALLGSSRRLGVSHKTMLDNPQGSNDHSE